MKNQEVFPCGDEITTAAIEAIARFVGCDEATVDRCFWGSETVIYNTPIHMDAVKDVTHSFNEAARHAKNLRLALTRMTAAQRRELEVAGCVTLYQIEHLADVLAQDSKDLSEWSRRQVRIGGRNLAAYSVAKAMRRLFRRMRKEITFGQDSGGGPSTEFGKTVQYALGAFGIKASWRGPAQEERDTQRQIDQRLARIKARQPRMKLRGKPDNVSITLENEGKDRTYVFAVVDRPDIEPYRICACRFRTGKEVEDYSAEWLYKISTNS